MWTAELPRTILESTRVVVLGAVPHAGVGSLDVAAAFEFSLLLESTPHLHSRTLPREKSVSQEPSHKSRAWRKSVMS